MVRSIRTSANAIELFMKRLLLHIGRHKTGTTAIQRFLHGNANLLRDAGWYYPQNGLRSFGHHELGAPLTRSALSGAGDGGASLVSRMRADLQKELCEQQSDTVISSEAFQNCKPEVIGELFADHDVQVVVYIREQTSYLLSAYAQRVQASDYTGSLEDFYRDTSHVTYMEFLSQWESVFPGRLSVRNYDRQDLSGGNVVVDFCHHFLSLQAEQVANLCNAGDANPSLTSDLLDFKLHVNRHLTLTAEQSRKLYHALARLAVEDESGSPRISGRLASKVAERYAKSNHQVARRYFSRHRLFKAFQPAMAPLTSGTSEERLSAIRGRIIEDWPELESCLSGDRLAEWG